MGVNQPIWAQVTKDVPASVKTSQANLREKQPDFTSQMFFQDWLRFRALEIKQELQLLENLNAAIEFEDIDRHNAQISAKVLADQLSIQAQSPEMKKFIEDYILLLKLDLEQSKAANLNNKALTAKIDKLVQAFETKHAKFNHYVRQQLKDRVADTPLQIKEWIAYQYLTLPNTDSMYHHDPDQLLKLLSQFQVHDAQMSEFLELKKQLIIDFKRINNHDDSAFMTIGDTDLYDKVEKLELLLDQHMVNYFLEQNALQ